MHVQKTDAALGAQVLGVDLSAELDDATIAQLNEAWLEHEVIFLRGQSLSPEQHIRFSERFGAVEAHVRADCCKPGYPKIFVVSNIVENGKPIGAGDAGTMWHSDGCCIEQPSRGSMLYARIVPQRDGVPLGDTMFSSMTRAYDALPTQMKIRLSGLKAVNSYVKGYYRPIRVGVRPELTEAQRSRVPDIEVPVVRSHPFTGKPCLFVNETFTARIAGVSDAQSADLLGFLLEHVRKPEFIYRHSWQEGDLLLWDNCSTLHCAIADYLPMPRLMERTTIVGTARVSDGMAPAYA